MAYRTCRKCGYEATTLSETANFKYNKKYKYNRTNLCKSCANIETREYLSTDEARSAKYKYKYGITLEEYELMFSQQEGCCKICGTHQTDLEKRLAVDHNHKNGKVRGLLCQSCNHAIGLLKDSSDVIRSALDYMEKDNEN